MKNKSDAYKPGDLVRTGTNCVPAWSGKLGIYIAPMRKTRNNTWHTVSVSGECIWFSDKELTPI